MLRLRLIRSAVVFGLLVASTQVACVRDVEMEEPIDLSQVVEAQFDPTNPIPVLQLVPSPTGLAENPDGTINFPRVRPESCELPTSAQCLEFVTGWPLTTPVTLYFSGPLEESSIQGAIKIYQVNTSSLTEVPYAAVSGARPAINPACMMGNNGSDPPMTYTEADVPGGIQLILTPSRVLRPNTKHIVLVKSGGDDGLVAANTRPVEPSALFSILNAPPENEPVLDDGTINAALLRSQAQSNILARKFSGRELDDLSADERVQFDAELEATGLQLRGLYRFFSAITGSLMQAQKIGDRTEAVFVNMWTTGGAPPPAIDFDPANSKVPFPNAQLLTSSSTAGYQVTLPIPPNASPSSRAMLMGLNTLDGFSTTAPMALTTNANVDASTLAGNVVMYPVNDQGMIDGSEVPVQVTTASASALAPATILIRPIFPLAENQNYVVGVKRGIKDAAGRDFVPASTFDLLKIPAPFITGDTVLPDVVKPLQCSTLQATGSLANDTQVKGIATQLENDLRHARWLEAFQSLEGASTPIPRTALLMAFNYKTQTITGTVDFVKNVLMTAQAWEQLLPGPQVVGPVVDIQGRDQIIATMGVVRQFCLPLCLADVMAPTVPANQCVIDTQGTPNPAIEGHQFCGLAKQIVASHLDRMRMYVLRGYWALEGSPFAAGTFTPETIAQPQITDIPFWVVTGTGTPGANGYPVAMFQHGLGGMKEHGFLIANTFARNSNGTDPAGWATLLMDLPFHGARATDISNNATGRPCVDGTGTPNIDPKDVTCTQTSSGAVCTGGCDGQQDGSATGFVTPNLFAARDNMRQSTIDQLTLLKAIRDGAIDYLDGTRIGYVGQSLGGFTGANLTAYSSEADLQASVINVAGGGIIQWLLSTIPQMAAPIFGALAQSGVCELVDPMNPGAGCKDTAAFRQFKLVAQWAVDPGDPLATSIGIVDPRPALPMPMTSSRVLMQVASPDPVVPNTTSWLFANALGFSLNPPDDHLSIYDFQGLPASAVGGGCHGFLLAPMNTGGGINACGVCTNPSGDREPDLVSALCNTIGAQRQAAGFISSGGATVPVPRSLPDLEPVIDCSIPDCQSL